MKDHKQVVRFIIVALSLCFGWFILYDFWLSSFDDWLTLKVVGHTVFTLNLIGYNASADNVMIQIDGKDVVFVFHACNGMVLMAIFSGFIIAFPGAYLKKLTFITVGILTIHMVNVFRVAALAINAHHFHQSLNFNHKYTFTILVYAVVFALWMLWVRKFSDADKHGNINLFSKQVNKSF